MKGNEMEFLFHPEEKIDVTFCEKEYIFKFPYTDEFIKITIHAGSDERLEFMHDNLKRFIERLIHYMR